MLIRILIIFSLNLAFTSYAKQLHIVTSTPHIASITQMITRDSAHIEVISNSNICPEHYQAKPSDIDKAKNADFAIYIDEKFEPFMNVLMPYLKKKLKISEIKSLYINDKNMHIWLDIGNVERILDHIYNELVKISPNDKALWYANLNEGKKQLHLLQLRKAKINLTNILLLSDSLEYLLHGTNIEHHKLYIYPGKVSMKTISKILSMPKATLFMGSSNDDWSGLEEKLGKHIISIDSEKWGHDYIQHYKSILEKLENASKSL